MRYGFSGEIIVLNVSEDDGRLQVIYEIEILYGRSIDFYELMQRRVFESENPRVGAPVLEFESAIANDGTDQFLNFYHLYFNQDQEE